MLSEFVRAKLLRKKVARTSESPTHVVMGESEVPGSIQRTTHFPGLTPMKTAAFTLPTQPKSGRNPPPGGSPLNLLDEVPSPQRYLALLPDDIKLRLELAGYNWKRLSHAGISDIWWRMPGSARAWLHTAGFSLVGQNKCTSTVGVEATKAEPPPSPEAHLLTPAGAPVAGITGAAM